MLCRYHHRDGGLQLAVYEFDEDFSALASLCGPSLAEYASASFGSVKRRCEWLAVRVVVRMLLGSDAAIAYTADGKPLLADGAGHISISHSGNLVAVAVHDSRDVGIDVELRSSRVAAIRGRVLSAVEEEALDRHNETDALLLHWSAKESFYKIIGNRGGSFVESFRVSPFVVEPEGIFGISYTKDGETIKQCEVGYVVCDDYVLTYCTDCDTLQPSGS